MVPTRDDPENACRGLTWRGSSMVLNPIEEDSDALFTDGSHRLGDDYSKDHRGRWSTDLTW